MTDKILTSDTQQQNPVTGEWEPAEPLPCPSWLAVQWEAFTDYIKGVLK